MIFHLANLSAQVNPNNDQSDSIQFKIFGNPKVLTCNNEYKLEIYSSKNSETQYSCKVDNGIIRKRQHEIDERKSFFLVKPHSTGKLKISVYELTIVNNKKKYSLVLICDYQVE